VALHGNTDVITPVKPTGIAKSLNIGDPAAGLYALEAVRRTGGWMDYADDDEIRDAIRLLARTTGIFAETAGGVTVAVLQKLVDAGRLDPDAETVVFNTGEGLKTLDAVASQVGPTYQVRPSLRAAREAGLPGLNFRRFDVAVGEDLLSGHANVLIGVLPGGVGLSVSSAWPNAECR
jgi:threonine synthase